ncbi:MAG: hypothetical protein FJ034_07920, partial [Chloroflexi bacterium]|nr:hypothetical protein [Chloroflexota bacterium]
ASERRTGDHPIPQGQVDRGGAAGARGARGRAARTGRPPRRHRPAPHRPGSRRRSTALLMGERRAALPRGASRGGACSSEVERGKR